MKISQMGIVLIGVFVLILTAYTVITINEFRFDDPNNIKVINATTNSYSAYGISFNYPSNWITKNSEVDDNKIIVVYNRNSTIPNEAPEFEINISPNPADISDEEALNLSRNSTNPSSWNKISNDTIIIDGETAYVEIFTDNNSTFSEVFKIEEIYFVKNKNTYNILLMAPEKTFDSEKPNFDLILNSLKIPLIAPEKTFGMENPNFDLIRNNLNNTIKFVLIISSNNELLG